MPRCPHCPVPSALPCEAETTGHRRYCELVALGREDYAALLVARATGVTPRAEAPPPAAEAERVARRRAAKPRVPLGTPRPQPASGGR